MQTVGVRDLKSRLTHYLRLIKAGEGLIVTERGKPVASMRPLNGTETLAGPEERLAALAKQGLVRLPSKTGRFDLQTQPLRTKGRAVSRIVIEDRR